MVELLLLLLIPVSLVRFHKWMISDIKRFDRRKGERRKGERRKYEQSFHKHINNRSNSNKHRKEVNGY